jgi:hypothetical protein
MLWVDKHRPTSLEKLSYHDDLSTRLADIVSRSPGFLRRVSYGSGGIET